MVTRSFQAGAAGFEGKSFDMSQFQKKVAEPINVLLRFPEVVGNIVVTTNGEAGNKLAEIIGPDGKTPTVRAFEEVFPSEVSSGKIILRVCADWGKNPGSGNALNEGIALATGQWVMCWSPEIEMDGYKIISALNLADEKKLMLVGFMRKRWWEKPQWNVVQNTACLWRTDAIKDIGGFAPECNGTGETVQTAEYGAVPLAGMEDFHAMLRLMGKYGDDFRWGLVGRKDPLHWDTDFPPGSEREENHLKKVARQYLVMKAYAGKIFAGVSFENLMDKLFSLRYQD